MNAPFMLCHMTFRSECAGTVGALITNAFVNITDVQAKTFSAIDNLRV